MMYVFGISVSKAFSIYTNPREPRTEHVLSVSLGMWLTVEHAEVPFECVWI